MDGIRRDASLTTTAAMPSARSLGGIVDTRDRAFPYMAPVLPRNTRQAPRSWRAPQAHPLPESNLAAYNDRHLVTSNDQLPLEKPHAIALGLALLLISLGLLSFVL